MAAQLAASKEGLSFIRKLNRPICRLSYINFSCYFSAHAGKFRDSVTINPGYFSAKSLPILHLSMFLTLDAMKSVALKAS
jgi:hypothetical protein